MKRDKYSIGRVNDSLEEPKYFDIRGQNVSGHGDLAAILKDWRTPIKEYFHSIYLDDAGTVIAHTVITSDSVDSVRIPAKELHGKIKQRAERIGAAAVYNAHNHPSGNIEPSREDIHLTRCLAAAVTIYKGHIILDHDRYAFISPAGKCTEHEVDLGKSYSATGESIYSPGDARQVLDHHYAFEDGTAGILVLDAQLRPVALEKVRFDARTIALTLGEQVKRHHGGRAILALCERDKKKFMKNELARKTPYLIDIVYKPHHEENLKNITDLERLGLRGQQTSDSLKHKRVFEPRPDETITTKYNTSMTSNERLIAFEQALQQKKKESLDNQEYPPRQEKKRSNWFRQFREEFSRSRRENEQNPEFGTTQFTDREMEPEW